jgi:hypothetical protein
MHDKISNVYKTYWFESVMKREHLGNLWYRWEDFSILKEQGEGMQNGFIWLTRVQWHAIF